METPIKINIDNNSYYSNKKEIEQVNELLAKKTKEFNARFFKEHCIPNSLLKEKGKLILIPNPNLYYSWLESLKNTPFIFGTGGEVDTCNGKDFDFFFKYFIKPTDSEIAIDSSFRKLQEIKNAYEKATHRAYPLTPNECFEKEVELNNKKHILVIGLPSNFFNIIKILKTNKNQYFVLYKDKYSLKGKEFDAIVVDSSMPYYLGFYYSVIKYIKYNIVTYVLENKILKLLK